MNRGSELDALGFQAVESNTNDIDQNLPFLLGVTGGTGAGKTTFARRLAKILATRQTVTLVDLDSYYKDFSDLSPPERYRVNFDDPDSIDLYRFREDLRQLKQGQKIIKPVYDLVACKRHTGGPVVVPGDVVIVEGLMLFMNESVRCLFDLRVYVDTPAEVRLRRRLERDVREGGRTLAGAIDHYIHRVLPIHESCIEPTKNLSNFVIPGSEDTENSLNEVASVIRQSLTQRGNPASSPISSLHETEPEYCPIEEGVPNQERTAN